MNPKRILKGLLRRWYLFLLTLSLTLGAAYLYLRYMPATYLVRATLLSNEQPVTGGQVASLEDDIAQLTSYKVLGETMARMNGQVTYFSRNHFITREEYQESPYRIQLDSSQVQLVNVPVYINLIDRHLYQVRVAARNVKVYDLLRDRQVDELPEVNITRTLRVGQPYRDKCLSIMVVFNQPPEMFYKDEYFFVINSLEERVNTFAGKLQVKPRSEQSRIIELTTRGSVPAKEKDFLNTLLAVYLDNQLQHKNRSVEETIAFIDQQLGVSGDSTGNAPVATKRGVNAAEDTSREGRIRLARRIGRYETLLQKVQNKEDFAASDTEEEDPELSSLLKMHRRLVEEKNTLQSGGQASPDKIEKAALQAGRVRDAIEDRVVLLLNQLQVTFNRSGTHPEQPATFSPNPPRAGRGLLSIRQKLSLNNQHIYDYLLERRADAGIAIAATTVDKTVIDPARVSGNGPISPDPFWVYSLAAVLGLIFPLAMIALKSLLQDKIVNQEDIELNTKIPTLGVVGYNEKANNYLVAFSSRSALAESFRSIRVNLQYLFLDTEKKIIGVTSAQQGEGKTFCATNLSVVMAQSGKKTLLIDTDLRKPRVAARFDMENLKGLATYLTGMHSLPDVVMASEVENLHIITSGPIPANPLNLIGNLRMESLIEWARREYDYVILDTPPMGLVADFLILMNYTDFNIFIVRHKLTERDGLSKINELYESNRIKNVGILINGVRSMSAYGYSEKVYRYGYGD